MLKLLSCSGTSWIVCVRTWVLFAVLTLNQWMVTGMEQGHTATTGSYTLLLYMNILVLYCRKLSREKTFTNFLLPTNFYFRHTYISLLLRVCIAYHAKFSFSTNLRKIYPLKFSHYTVYSPCLERLFIDVCFSTALWQCVVQEVWR